MMNKQKLLENYTPERLAEIVIRQKKVIGEKCGEINRIKINMERKEKDNHELRCQVERYNNYILPRCTKEAKKLIDKNAFPCIRIIAIGEEKKKCDCGKEDEINCLKKELDRKETAINQIDDILNELFGVTHDIVSKPDEFKEILKEKIENNKTIADFLPAEPIEAAIELINASYTRNKGELEKRISKAFGNTSDTIIERLYSASELRQIAEHLLVYCNAKGEGENE